MAGCNVLFSGAQVHVILITKRTLILNSWFLNTMHESMLFQITSRCEIFITLVTLIRSFSCMNTLMSNQVTDLRESFLTSLVQTFIWLLLIMYSLMFLKRTVLCKRGLTLVAAIKWQSYHEYGLSPVCVLWCSRSVFLQENCLLHLS